MSLHSSKFTFYASCGVGELNSLAGVYPTEVSTIAGFIPIIQHWQKQKVLLYHIMTDLTALNFPELIPVISDYMGSREPSNEENAMVKEKMDCMDPQFPLISYSVLLAAFDDVDDDVLRLNINKIEFRLMDNLFEMSALEKNAVFLHHGDWNWEMLKHHFHMVCEKLLPSSINDELYQVKNADKPPGQQSRRQSYFAMPEEYHDKKFVLVCEDNVSLEVEGKAAWEMGIIRNLVEYGIDVKSELKLPVGSNDLRIVIEFCRRLVSRKRARIDDGASSSQDTNLEPLPQDLSHDKIFMLHEIAEYLMIDSLLEWTSGLMVDMIRGKTAEEIRNIIDLESGGEAGGTNVRELHDR